MGSGIDDDPFIQVEQVSADGAVDQFAEQGGIGTHLFQVSLIACTGL
jgi:hypothetical protein